MVTLQDFHRLERLTQKLEQRIKQIVSCEGTAEEVSFKW